MKNWIPLIGKVSVLELCFVAVGTVECRLARKTLIHYVHRVVLVSSVRKRGKFRCVCVVVVDVWASVHW